jgi:RNA polymerase sigma-70 factor (ECF subfamily)
MDDTAADALLLAAVARDDSAAFDPFYDRFARPLYTLGLRWLGDRLDAEELVSETFVRAWRQADRYDRRRGSPSSWLFGIARHVATDMWRRRQRTEGEPLDGEGQAAATLDIDRLAAAADLAAALDKLSPIHRQVIVLAYGCEQTEAQISQRLAIPIGTVKSRRYHALRGLARILSPRDAPAPIAGGDRR